MTQKISYAKTVYGQAEIDAVVKCLQESTQMGKNSPRLSDIGSQSAQTKTKKQFSRNDPKRSGNGSYSFWESWEPVFIVNDDFLYQTKIFVLIIYYPYSLLNSLSCYYSCFYVVREGRKTP